MDPGGFAINVFLTFEFPNDKILADTFHFGPYIIEQFFFSLIPNG